MSKAWALLKENWNALFWEDFKQGLIDLRPVGWDVRLLVAAGLLTVLVTLGATLLFGHGSAGSKVTFTPDPTNAPDATFSIPFVALLLAMLTFTVGWALLLAGAARCRFWVLALAGVLFAIQALVLGNAIAGSAMPLLAFVCLEPLGIGMALGGYFGLRYLRRRWPWVGMIEIVWWLGLVSVFIALIWIGSESSAAVASYFTIGAGVVIILAAFLWFYLAVDIVDIGIKLGYLVVNGVRPWLPPQPARWLILAPLLLKPVIAFGITETDFLVLDIVGSLAVAMAAVVLLVLRRYSATAAYVLLSLSVVLSVVSVGLALAERGNDFSEFILEWTGLASPLVSFVVLTVWDMAASGARFANGDGKNLPRAGRMLLYGGALTLAVTASGNPLLEQVANSALASGLGSLGLFYII